MTDRSCSAVERKLMFGPAVSPSIDSASGRGYDRCINHDLRRSEDGSENYQRTPPRSCPALLRVTSGGRLRGRVAQAP
jgi:hypothetical protein